jgi:CRP-like cAMP-binding protein
MAHFMGRPFDIKPGRKDDKKSILRRILSLPASLRLKGQVYEVEKILQENQFLMRYAGTKQLTELIYKMTVKTFEARSTIVSQGDQGDTFFIILSGRLAVHNPEQDNIKIKELLSGNSFGEQCLISADPYPFTYLAIEACELITLTRSAFESSIYSLQSQIMHKSYLFFKSLPLLSKVSEKLINYFSQVAFIKKFMPNTPIVKQDEFANGIFVIVEGSAKVKRKVSESLTIFIDELGVGEFFCDNSFFNKSPMHHSIICAMPLVAYYLDKDDLASLDPVLLNEFRKACKPYPDDSVLLSMYYEQKVWKSFKQEIIKTVAVEKELRK